MVSSNIVLVGSQSYLARSFVNWLSKRENDIIENIIPISRSNNSYAYLYRWLNGESELLDNEFTRRLAGARLVHFSSALKPNTPVNVAPVIAEQEMLFNRRLATMCSKYGVSALVYISSGGALYGNTSATCDESHALNPLSAYGRAKADAEGTFRSEAEQGGWIFQSLRLSNPFGPLQLEVMTHGLIPALIRSCYSGTTFQLYGDGRATKDYIHVDDFCAALYSTIERPMAGAYNVSFGQSYSINDLIREVEIASNRCISVMMYPSLKGDVHDVHLSNKRFSALYGWSPSVSLNEGIKSMWDFHAAEFTPRLSL